MPARKTQAKCALITGPTSGIGRAVALALADLQVDLVLVSRDASRGRAISDWLARRHPTGRFEFIPCDLSHLASVREAVASIHSQWPRLDLLINNAGARFDTFQQSVDGHELTFATNHLGPFLLTALLLGPLLETPSPRIINVSSSAHAGATRPASWLMSAANYDRRQAYARSKLANLLFTYALGRRLAGTAVTVNAMHPGGVASGFARNNGLISWLKHVVSHGLRRELIAPRRGADTITYLATSPEVAGVSGKYFFERRPVESSALSHDPFLARDLWSESARLCNLDSTLAPAGRYFVP